MATRARTGADLAVTINANTSAPSNTLVVSSSGNVTTANDLSLTSGHLVGYVSNTYLQANFVPTSATMGDTRLDLANAEVTFVTKSTALASNNALINLISDREQVANAAVSYVTKSVHLSSNNALINLINDREQVGNVDATLVDYWPSANIIAYVGGENDPIQMQTNTSIFIATGGETEVAIPYTNTSHIQVKLNGVRLTPDEDYLAANNTHIGSLLALSAADVLTVTEYRQHTSNVLNRSAGSGGGAYSFQGSTSGYNSSGYRGTPPYSQTADVDKFSFTSDGNATAAGDLTLARVYAAGSSSSTHGYTSGGNPPALPTQDVIDKFPFATDDNATDVGDLTAARYALTGQSSSTSGYTSGGRESNIIEKFPFASDGNATDVGDLLAQISCLSGQSSSTHGYTSGGEGHTPPTPFGRNTIQKFAFASDGNSTDVGDLVAQMAYTSGQSSSTHGYASGGEDGNDAFCIQKFAFASDGNATNIGSLAQCARRAAGQSSTAAGYVSGGHTPSDNQGLNNIQKFPFASDDNGSDIGDLTAGISASVGQQV
jgi:hypothetical protein